MALPCVGGMLCSCLGGLQLASAAVNRLCDVAFSIAFGSLEACAMLARMPVVGAGLVIDRGGEQKDIEMVRCKSCQFLMVVNTSERA